MNNYLNKKLMRQPYVFLVDSPSHNDLFSGYSIGMGLRDALRAIRIPCFYYLATNRDNFNATLQYQLQYSVNQMQQTPGIDAVPFIHLCMHGWCEGIALTDNTTVSWQELRNLLYMYNNVKGFNPFLCMASCEGMSATNMTNAFDCAFDIVVGNEGAVLQSDVTVAYLAFYNQLIFKGASVQQAVEAMRVSSGDSRFYFATGDQVRNQKFAELNSQNLINTWGTMP
ncbi:TPA: hypothetical protein SMI07_001696 [Serratia liquefaciens]|nr:hypothetical protein [Serratia liquefaciens]